MKAPGRLPEGRCDARQPPGRPGRWLPVLLAVGVWALPGAALAEQAPAADEAPAVQVAPQLPRVLVLSTGGTIAGTGYVGEKQRQSSDLLEALPALGEIAEVRAEDPFTLPSSQLRAEHLQQLADLVRQRFADDPELAGIVITQGTDSLEEVAFYLDLVVDDPRPVVVTGAMRVPSHPDSDGPRNLLGAVRLAASPALRGYGVLVTLHQEIHAARELEKRHSSALDAFESPATGPVGILDEERIYLFQRPMRRLTLPPAAPEPRVALVKAHTGSDGTLVRAAVDSGAKGLVLELFGRGNVPRSMVEHIGYAYENGVAVVFTSRTGEGRVSVFEGWKNLGVVSAQDLGGLKARLVLVASLTGEPDRGTLQGYFHALSGLVPAEPPPVLAVAP